MYREGARGWTSYDSALVDAVKEGNMEYARVLLERYEAVPYAFDNESLVEATNRKKWDIAELLLDHGAYPDQKGFALWSAVESGNEELTRRLFERCRRDYVPTESLALSGIIRYSKYWSERGKPMFTEVASFFESKGR